MSDALRYIALGMVGCVLALLLREAGFKGARLVSIIATVGLLGIGTVGIGRIFTRLFSSAEADGLSELVAAALRILGIGYVFGICSDVCRDSGEGTLATHIETVGKVELLLLCIPLIEKILATATRLLQMGGG